MEPEEQTAVLYDFLYRDRNRISSYYAQIFKGKLSSLEETSSDKSASNTTIKTTVGVVGSASDSGGEIESSLKRVVDPHDIVTSDVLAFLYQSGRISEDVVGAAHGSLVLAHGRLILVDRYMLKLADIAFETLINEEQAKSKKTRDPSQLNILKTIRRFMSDLPLPSAFSLTTDACFEINGTVKEDGMEDLISSYYFKYGEFGLQDVYVVGIKETTNVQPLTPTTILFLSALQAVKSLSEVLFSESSIRVTPLVFFRKLPGGPIIEPKIEKNA